MSKATQTKKLGKLTVGEFFARFPDEAACLNHLMKVATASGTSAGLAAGKARFTSLRSAVPSHVPIVAITS